MDVDGVIPYNSHLLGHIVAPFTKLPSKSCAICSQVVVLKLQSRASQKSTSSSATSPSWGIATAHWLRFAGPAPKKAAIRSSATGPYRQTKWWCKEPCIFFWFNRPFRIIRPFFALQKPLGTSAKSHRIWGWWNPGSPQSTTCPGGPLWFFLVQLLRQAHRSLRGQFEHDVIGKMICLEVFWIVATTVHIDIQWYIHTTAMKWSDFSRLEVTSWLAQGLSCLCFQSFLFQIHHVLEDMRIMEGKVAEISSFTDPEIHDMHW